MSIFVFTKANIEFFKHKPSFSGCKAVIQDAPYGWVEGRICYHVHESPEYVIHENLPIRYTPELYASYLHLYANKKPLYAMASYTHAELVDLATRLELPLGTKSQMYSKIKDEIDKFMTNFKKIDSR
jgi:hypothetical protein